MKPWLICVIALAAGNAYSQVKTRHLTLYPGDSVFTRTELKARDAKRKQYFSFTTTTGVYPLIGITSRPVANFQYRYANGPMLSYQAAFDAGSGPSRAGYNFGAEWGKKKGVFYNFSVGGLMGLNQNMTTKYFSTGIGYNIQTGIPGVVLQPSVAFAKTTVESHLPDIPQNQQDIFAFNKTLRYKNSCGCTANSTQVIALNSTSFAQTKLAIKYNINRIIAVSAGVTYYVPLNTSFHLELQNKNNFVKRSGYVSPSAMALQDDNRRDTALPFYGEVTVMFNLAATPKVKRALRPGTSGSTHHHSGGFHGGHSGGHCH